MEVDGISHNSETEYHSLSADPESGHGAIDPSSKWLAGIVKDTNIAYVRTSHHQAVDPEALGKGLTVVAYASDGTVEAMEYQENLFALSLQWHPEKDALGDTKDVAADPDLSSALLRALVSHAGIYRNNKHG